jgi:hypothetical protein
MGWKAKDLFFKSFDKKIMFNGFRMSSFRCRSHVGAFIIKGAKECVYTHKILHPHDFEK